MTELHDLLDRAAADLNAVDPDVAGDLRRGHRALTRRRTRWATGVTSGLVAAGAVGYIVLPRQQSAATTLQPADGPTSAPVSPTYYDVPQPPAGWHVLGQRPQYVMLSRDGSNADLDSFAGQVVVALDDGQEGFDHGPSLQLDGRTVYVNQENTDATILSVRSPDGDWLQVQYPKDEFGVHEMAAYLTGVVVGPDAQPARG